MRTLISTSRPKLDRRLAACAVALALCFFAVTKVDAAVDEEQAALAKLTEQERFERGLIEIHYAPDYLSPYKERRASWAPVFGLNYANVVPVGFVTDLPSANGDAEYGAIFGSAAMPMFSYFGGVQFNLGGISIGPTVGMAMGEVGGGTRTLRLNVKSAGITANLDSIMNEPYVVPTFSFAINVADYAETNDADTSSAGTTPFMSYTVGALIQLNWIDPDGAFEGLKESGLNNTFVHLYGGQFMASSGDSTSFASNFSLGAGVRLEF